MRPFQGVQNVVELKFLEGNVAVIPCSVPYSQPKAVIEFEFNGTKLPFSGECVGIYLGSLNGSLAFQYSCTVCNWGSSERVKYTQLWTPRKFNYLSRK